MEFPLAQTSMSTWLNRHGPDAPGYPCKAAAFVQQNIPPTTGKIINDFNWGGYLAWELGDSFKVYMDARTQLYTPRFWEMTCLADDEQLRSTLRAVRADAAIVPLKSQRLSGALRALGWKQVFQDDRAAVLVPANSPVADVR
jgi:hypothetical protein